MIHFTVFIYRFCGIRLYISSPCVSACQEYKNDVEELGQKIVPQVKTGNVKHVENNHTRAFHDKYFRSNRRLSDFELRNFHVALAYETIEMRSFTICRSPFFSQ